MRAVTVASSAILWILLLSVVLWSIVPIALLVSASFKDPKMVFEYPPRILFRPTLSNYRDLFTEWSSYLRGLANSAIITASTVVWVLVCGTMTAFAFSRFGQRKLVKVSAFFMIAIRMFPPIIITIPLFPVLRSTGFVDKHITIIVLYVAFIVSLATWIMKSFIDDIPIQIEEAAFVDGCNQFQAFTKVTLPLAAPGIITTAIFAAIFCWNEFLFAFIFAPAHARTAPVAISEMLGSVEGVAWGSLFAATVLQLVPMLVLTWTIQKYLVKGMTLGAVKQ